MRGDFGFGKARPWSHGGDFVLGFVKARQWV